jgi:hypothetical protein
MSSVDYQVSASEDDGDFPNSGGTFDKTKALIILGSDSGVIYNNWYRWNNVTIPDNVTITSAYVSLYRAGAFGTPATCAIYFEKSANPDAPIGFTDIRGRTKTDTYVEWDPPSAGTWLESPDIKSIIQELVDNYSYSSGAAMMMLFMGAGSGNNRIVVRTYDVSATNAPKLHIEYELKKSFVLPRRRRMDAMVVR